MGSERGERWGRRGNLATTHADVALSLYIVQSKNPGVVFATGRGIFSRYQEVMVVDDATTKISKLSGRLFPWNCGGKGKDDLNVMRDCRSVHE